MSDVSSTPARRGVHVPTWVFVTIGGVLLFGIAFAIGRRSERRHLDGGRFDHAGRHGLGVLLLVIVLALVITGIVLAVRHFSGGRQRSNATRDRDAENLLAQRFAQGEIDEAEYRSRLDTAPGVDRAAVHAGHYGGAGAPLA